MAVTSTMLPLGTHAPPFELTDVRTNQPVSSADLDAKALLVIFMCNHCPYVKHVQHGLAQLGEDYAGREIDIVAISSNDPQAYPEDAPEELARTADEVGYRFPVLFDENQDVARAYQAACTPDFFLFDADHRLVYRGQLDDSRPANGLPVTGKDLRRAIDAALGGRTVPEDQRPSMGCSIKWKPGKEPVYLS